MGGGRLCARTAGVAAGFHLTQMAASQPHVAIACGGTGGHFFPGVAVARALQQQNVRVTLWVSNKAIDQKAVATVPDLAHVSTPAVALNGGDHGVFCLDCERRCGRCARLWRTTGRRLCWPWAASPLRPRFGWAENWGRPRFCMNPMPCPVGPIVCFRAGLMRCWWAWRLPQSVLGIAMWR